MLSGLNNFHIIIETEQFDYKDQSFSYLHMPFCYIFRKDFIVLV